MTNSIYITTIEPYSGKSLVSLGITELLLRRTPKVGIFRPVIEAPPNRQRDKNIDLLLRHYNLDLNYDDTYAYYRKDVSDLIAEGRYDEFLDRIIAKYKYLESQCDFVLCIGSDFVEEGGSALEFNVNADIARHLSSPVLIVTNANHQTIESVVNEVKLAHEAFEDAGCQVLGTIVNRADLEVVYDLLERLEDEMPHTHPLLSVIPARNMLSSPTLREVAEYLDARVLYGGEQLEQLAYNYHVVAMKIPNYLPHLTENALLITPGDRCDVILSALQAHESRNYPKVAGLLLTGGLRPPQAVDRLLAGLNEVLPILSVSANTYQTALNIGDVRSYITADSVDKIKLSLRLFDRHVNTAALEEQLTRLPAQGITPKMFIYNLIQMAKADKKHIVLPEGADERILQAAASLLRNGVVDLTLLGDPDEINAAIYNLGLKQQLSNVTIDNPLTSARIPEYAETLMELRKHKGMNRDMATDQLTDVSYFGTMMVYKGDADGMVSGAAHTTQHTIRPALQFVKTKPGFSVVSSVFFMALPDRVLVYGDCAVNPNPTAEQLAEIAISSADTAQAFGIQPRIAMLSYSSGASGHGEDVERVREATKIAQKRRPDLILEGPMQYDAAVSPEVAAKKMPGSQVAGTATVFIFPDLNTGNNTYKAVQRETGAIAIGPVLQGLKKPVNDLSRGCTVEDVINTVAITAVQAQRSRENN